MVLNKLQGRINYEKNALGLWSILLITMYFSSSVVFAEATQSASQQKTNESESNKVVTEDVDRRTTNTKHYLMEDGSYQAKYFLNDVHYKDELGIMQEINTSLEDEAGLLKSKKTMSKEAKKKKSLAKDLNAESSSYTSFQVPYYSEIPKKISKGYSIEKDGEKLTFIPLGASARSTAKLNSKDKNKVTYSEVWSNTDVELKLLNTGVKENNRGNSMSKHQRPRPWE
ncbi:hypothetical protein [Paenibacillus sp. NPDC058174]|uniref:hypothetical protein n=1 Tax=Paenibacillus sp. NPDC058174 TaxID=3346366 RepID=UPI0036D7E259